MSKTRTVTMTDRRPVKIDSKDWPRIALANGDSWTGADYSRHEQASCQGELDEYHLVVRRHQDGRVLVYGILSAASAWTGTPHDRRGGYLLNEPGDDEIVDAISKVAAECRLPSHMAGDCVAGLAPETL